MKLTIDIPDDLYELYEKQALTTGKEEVENRLLRFKDVPRDDRALVIFGDQRRQLEGIFQTTLESFDRLIAQIKNLGSVKIGPIERVFTPSEIIRLQDQARFHGWSEVDYMKLTVDEALDYVFNRM